ncbi:MAG: hypothetical protein QOG10_6895 [Kribbellaceae bacterium]|jgi:hypothetical protein|nr:hypothetical protein [Kribbellaceae bacterium]
MWLAADGSNLFAGREFERARSAWRPERPGLGSSQPLDTARLRALEMYLKGVPDSSQQPPWPGGDGPV